MLWVWLIRTRISSWAFLEHSALVIFIFFHMITKGRKVKIDLLSFASFCFLLCIQKVGSERRLCNVNIIQVNLFSIFQSRISSCTFLIPAHNQFKPMEKVRNTLSEKIFLSLNLYVDYDIRWSQTILLIRGRAWHSKLTAYIPNSFDSNVWVSSNYWFPALSTQTRRIPFVLDFNEDKIWGERALPMFCRNLFQSQNKPFTSHSTVAETLFMNINWLIPLFLLS